MNPTMMGSTDTEILYRTGRLLQHARAQSPNTRVKTRGQFPEKVTWNGDTRHFPKYKTKFQSWLLQTSMGYIADLRFLSLYRSDGWDDARTYAPPGISTAQYMNDRSTV